MIGIADWHGELRPAEGTPRRSTTSFALATTGPALEARLRRAFELEPLEDGMDHPAESLIREDRSVLDLLAADYTYVNERLARHYGLPGIYGSHLRRVRLGPQVAERRGGVWTSRYRPYQRTEVRRTVRGEVRGGLESSLRVAGGPTSLAVSMAGVLQWDLDFNRDLRLGDEFEVLFDELLLDGEHERVLVVHALRYRNRDRWHEAFRYTGAEDDRSNYYYNADGQPLRRQFLSSPLPYSRVTSRFSMSRFHPILKRRMPHYGVDYGAPVGTPVRATASGTVLSAGVRGGGGRTVRLKHPHDYLTAYLHLPRYGEGIRAGARVEQGQVIGYVGSSGLSTGPHLDYRVQHRGRWINPARLTNDRIPPLAGDQLGPFLERRDALRRELRGGPGSAIRAGL